MEGSGMGKLRDSVILKTVAFVLYQVCFVIMAITVFIGVTYWNYDDATFDIIEQDDFTKTNYYKRMVEEEIYKLITYIEGCGRFQTDGETNLERVVDIYDYVRNDHLTGETTISLGYRICDLLDWWEDGFVYRSVADNRTAESVWELEEDTAYMLEETYRPVSVGSVQEYAQMNQLDYKEVCEMLEEASTDLAAECEEYMGKVSFFKAKNTNLRYVVYRADVDELYTNMNISGVGEGLERLQNPDAYSYVVLDSTNADFNSNIFYAEDQLNRYLNTLYINNEKYILAVGVDTDFPVLDSFHKEQLRYDNFEGWFRVLYKLLIVSVAGFVICFFYLSVAAGHKKGCDHAVLTVFDRIKTELLLLGFGVGEAYFIYTIHSRINGFSLPSMNPVTIIRIGILSLFAGLVFTICYLSFLRRYKAGTLWENSFLYKLMNAGKGLRQNTKLLLETLLFYAAAIVCGYLVCWQTARYLEVVIAFLILVILGYFYISDRLEKQKIIDGCRNIADGDMDYQIETRHFNESNRLLGDTVNQIKFVLQKALEDSIKNERLKTNLITNVSHDIKTPLTSIINYVSLLKGIELNDETASGYVQILDDKSRRLKHLTEDLVEASKISSGNITLEKSILNLVELVKQTGGEFYERFEEKSLTLVTLLPEQEILIDADGRRIWRILENVYQNALKYSLASSRVYAQLTATRTDAVFTLKNISAQPLLGDAEELTGRFVRGDESRTTEGSGLGLSIAKDLTQLHGGSLKISSDGDLFCVTLVLPLAQPEEA